MRWRLLPTIHLMSSLLGCTADERQTALCRQIVATLATDATDISALPVEQDGMLRFGFADAAELGRHQVGLHEVTCRFGGGAFSAGRLDLMAVEVAGAAHPHIRMILFRHVIGLPTPRALLEPAASGLPRP